MNKNQSTKTGLAYVTALLLGSYALVGDKPDNVQTEQIPSAVESAEATVAATENTAEVTASAEQSQLPEVAVEPPIEDVPQYVPTEPIVEQVETPAEPVEPTKAETVESKPVEPVVVKKKPKLKYRATPSDSFVQKFNKIIGRKTKQPEKVADKEVSQPTPKQNASALMPKQKAKSTYRVVNDGVNVVRSSGLKRNKYSINRIKFNDNILIPEGYNARFSRF